MEPAAAEGQTEARQSYALSLSLNAQSAKSADGKYYVASATLVGIPTGGYTVRELANARYELAEGQQNPQNVTVLGWSKTTGENAQAVAAAGFTNVIKNTNYLSYQASVVNVLTQTEDTSTWVPTPVQNVPEDGRIVIHGNVGTPTPAENPVEGQAAILVNNDQKPKVVEEGGDTPEPTAN